ncbi:late competence development ComFB family protein [bacterium]|nr:late competence development ComFB family protein [bacterium]
MLRNLMEDQVEAVLSELLLRSPSACACDRCRIDMMAFALNNLPPRYVVDESGALGGYLEATTASLRADVEYCVSWAIQMISARPRHARARGVLKVLGD